MAYPIFAPNCTWYKGTTKRATITQINIVDSYTPTGSENESWNADVDSTGSIKCYITGTVLTIAGNGSGKLALNADAQFMFSDVNGNDMFEKVTNINGTNILDTSRAEALYAMFTCCKALKSVDVSNWNTSNVYDIGYVFYYCQSLTSVDVSNWDVSNVNYMDALFYRCSSITSLNVSKWNTSQVTTLRSTFSYCPKLTSLDVSKWNTSNVTNMQWTFYQATFAAIQGITNWDVSKVTTMYSMLGYCTGVDKTLDLTGWDVSNVEQFCYFMVHGSFKIKGLETWHVSSKCQNIEYMFYTCRNSIIDVSNWDLSNCENFGHCFAYTTKLEKIIGLETWNTEKVKSFIQMFHNSAVKELNLSSFNTKNASVNYVSPASEESGGMNLMFLINENNYPKLKKVIIGENFSFAGDGTGNKAVLPTPTTQTVSDADGKWYTLDGTAYSSSAIPSCVANTYYASIDAMDVTYLADHPSLLRLASSIRALTGSTKAMTLQEMKEEIDNVELGGMDTSDATVTAADILLNKTAYGSEGKMVGTMPNNGEISAILDGVETTQVVIPEGYTSGGIIKADLSAIDGELNEAIGTQTEIIEDIEEVVDNLGTTSNYYDIFWDTFQYNGQPAKYDIAFYYPNLGTNWSPESFKPKHVFNCTSVSNMFKGFYMTSTTQSKLIDFTNVEFDVTALTNASDMFADACVDNVTLKFSEKIASLTRTFTKGAGGGVKGMHITLLVPNPDCTWTDTFAYHNVASLKLLEGTKIGKAINISWARYLSHDDAMGIINCLVPVETQQQVKFHSNVLATLTEEEKQIAIDKNWKF